ncbi:alpha/beta fold hydrolase [Phaeobacter gallaeciensis]|uniref:alpha/beta fold hydrolase n=1 Tax=Phaeobacter gallaeciensis TaxID=60890 RepID=UPI00237F0643|nr:alpha/beta hydrolase [Phaeobacter gallaeciensis]MDE4191181.1 alpha/beta hydrolase [Phaeobacter gallaeciensis]MDE4199646.1 alpha/beta hydrolase [Phaeobacter gallaeciensis]MDE4203794.1 alpha/beta hydrolase [Phaeobacter gallaeciensis]MDE4207936.1 alpha/beta hydrolase [Phaeobacter gallaeciensis]MDE4216303.1 alpha/beta hydrolase [Phaeobacter gallaeciensis]
MQAGFETLNGKAFFVRRWGDPALPPLLMLHGFPEYGGAWQELAERLCHRFHCIAPDQRGYGQSWAPQDVGDYATSRLVTDMADLIPTTGAPVTVLGHDWGAAVAYGLAMFRPNLVSRLIIANGVHPVPFQRALATGGPQAAASQYIADLRRDGLEADLMANDFEKLLALFGAPMDMSWLSGERLEAYKVEWSRPGRLRGMVNWYRASPLQLAQPGSPIPMPDLPLNRLQVPQPHLLIWGADDSALLPEATEGLEDFAPNLTRITLKGCDHWLHHQRPDEMSHGILTWSEQSV